MIAIPKLKNMKKSAVVLATGLAIFLLSACKKAETPPRVIDTPKGEIFVDENAFDFCTKQGGRIEMATTKEGGVMQFCSFGEGDNTKRCGIYSFYKGDCTIAP
jgi:putative hemolysin